MSEEKPKMSLNDKRPILIILVITFLLSGIGFTLNKLKNTGVSKSIKGTESISLDLWLDEVPTTNSKLFTNNDYTNLIIRNRPHGKLKITSSNCIPLTTKRFYLRRVSIPTDDEPMTEPFAEPFLWQCRLTLLDNQALSTENGYLSHGNQLKMGTRISLEGANYRVDGFIVNIQPTKLKAKVSD